MGLGFEENRSSKSTSDAPAEPRNEAVFLFSTCADDSIPVPLLETLLGAPHGSPFLDAPSPKGSLDGEESEGGAGEPHASSVLPGAAAGAPHGSLSSLDPSPNASE